MTTEGQSSPANPRLVHLLIGDLSRTACQLPAMQVLGTTTVPEHATCRDCLLNSGRF